MTPLPSSFRYERKFVAHGLPVAEVLAVVRRHRGLFREAYPTRAVNNLYLDSPGLRDYRDHTSGVPNRAKTRIRWYGSLAVAMTVPTLECKIRRGLVGGKLSWRLPPLALAAGTSFRDIDLASAWAALPEAPRLLVASLRPALVNRYQRHYFVSADGCFRLTVDSDLQFLAPHSVPEWVRPSCLQGSPVVIELKFAPSEAERADDISRALPFRLTRCSKYVLGIEATAPR